MFGSFCIERQVYVWWECQSGLFVVIVCVLLFFVMGHQILPLVLHLNLECEAMGIPGNMKMRKVVQPHVYTRPTAPNIRPRPPRGAGGGGPGRASWRRGSPRPGPPEVAPAWPPAAPRTSLTAPCRRLGRTGDPPSRAGRRRVGGRFLNDGTGGGERPQIPSERDLGIENHWCDSCHIRLGSPHSATERRFHLPGPLPHRRGKGGASEGQGWKKEDMESDGDAEQWNSWMSKPPPPCWGKKERAKVCFRPFLRNILLLVLADFEIQFNWGTNFEIHRHHPVSSGNRSS